MDTLTLARAASDAYWRERAGTDTYFPASAGDEQPTRYDEGVFTYVFNPDTRTHGWLCHAHDIVYTSRDRREGARYVRA